MTYDPKREAILMSHIHVCPSRDGNRLWLCLGDMIISSHRRNFAGESNAKHDLRHLRDNVAKLVDELSQYDGKCRELPTDTTSQAEPEKE